jgi:hypothetical protein
MSRGAENGRVTAGELLARLEADPEFVARREERRRVRAQTRAAFREAERPLVMALHATGVNVDTAWDLVDTSHPYPDALPILVEHLGRRGTRRFQDAKGNRKLQQEYHGD